MENMTLVSADTVRKIATYIKEAQASLIEADEMKKTLSAFDTMAEKAAETLVNANMLSEHLKAAKVDEFRSNPSKVLEDLEKAAAAAAVVEPVGTAAKEASFVQDEELSADNKFAQSFLG
jgi:hypothetical protein